MAAGCGLVAGILAWQGKAQWWYLASVGGVFAVAALVAPKLLAPVRRQWMRLAEPMGRVGNRVVLTVFFFVVFAPFALVVRLLGRDRLDLRGEPRRSYWERMVQDEPTDYTQPFWGDDVMKLWQDVKTVLAFFKKRRLWWLAPMLVLLFALAGFLVVVEGSALAPFIYTLF
jgi:Family of unknown function (DUF5989)/Saxitoxin biosynthesis operon protein SxtJ